MESLPTQPHSHWFVLFRQMWQNDVSSHKPGTVESYSNSGFNSIPLSHYKRKLPHSFWQPTISSCFRRRCSPTFSGFPTPETARGFRATGIAPPSMGSLNCSDSGIVTVDVNTAKNLLHSGYAFLDVRTVEEFEKGHVATEKIVNVPYLLNSPNGRVKNDRFLEEVLAVFKKDDRLVVGCRSGVRSLLAIEDLHNDGFKHLKDLGGGHLAWLENGFAVTNPMVKTTDPKVVEDLKVKVEL